eukprot:CAMPEP_0194486440 /NCGR_PEP_ID=MMETSP0253-20130528/7091_1 /TAXON_ID=2966 /ORGANISM="Noctiluca scintillans" /LENGTH=170 /DNA_ID=CAMNT_0039326531 /DNA_START=98 /DNA_END=608 /DNA_ORIENTATION=-
MDSLYNRGFANKKNLDEAAKNFKPEDFARQLQNGQPAVATSRPAQIAAGSTQPAIAATCQPAPITVGSTQQALPSSRTPANAAPSGQRTWTPANLPNQAPASVTPNNQQGSFVNWRKRDGISHRPASMTGDDRGQDRGGKFVAFQRARFPPSFVAFWVLDAVLKNDFITR